MGEIGRSRSRKDQADSGRIEEGARTRRKEEEQNDQKDPVEKVGE